MDVRSLVDRIKSSKVLAIGVGVLVIAAGGGAYYFYVYEPQSAAPAPAPVVAKKPQPALAKPAPSPAPAAPKQNAPAVPPGSQPAIAAAPGAAAPATPAPIAPPAPVAAAAPAKPMTAVQSEEPKKAIADTKPEKSAKSEQVTNPGQAAKPEKTEHSGKPEQVTEAKEPAKPEQSATQDDALDSAKKSEKARATRDEPPATAEAAPVVADEPVRPRGGIIPKYNDIMTPVLRGDRDAVKELLDLGWWVDKPEADGTTPLMAAVMNRDTEMVQLLLDRGAEPSPQAIRIARKNKDLATSAILEQKAAR